MRIDPHYKLLVGRFYDKIVDEYPYHEELPTAYIPDEISGYIVKHRFRKKENEWPLIQLGPGILTVNDTEGYIWEDFEKRIIIAISTLYDLYPEPEENLIINRLMLRYIDSIEFDFKKDNIFNFLKNKLKTEINLYQNLFDNKKVLNLPSNFNLRFDFKSLDPKGTIFLRFVSGKKGETDALIWETVVQSDTEDMQKNEYDISNWIKKAHEITDDWFFKLIDGELLKRFE